ncbi:amino acid adenylation domain-containing protein [Pseudohalocynthiibacter sp. F2068]|uniref:amino acid adenylation domain-containing protein n=1 Tax=Pseudohalocynthiibacter sp. F2068 TaxID=2926418 RepID=UPI001FF336D1|nr:amino acid adenylation domain-containing protein [Pseudohalocynthiibacter sp. F2068]MCK0103943.1 amino acid adenylation domain-containing protein [Pseudohalocynthiibacter sp. F2068]
MSNLLIRSANLTPDTIAVSDATGNRFSFAELDTLANDVAFNLSAFGVKPGDRVGLCARKSIDTVGAIFGILRAGAVYVPVDPTAPIARSSSIFTDCEVQVVLADTDKATPLATEMAELGFPVTASDIEVSGFSALLANNSTSPGDRDLAYILYTSGSTGKPKGVTHSHTSALAFVDWCSDEFKPYATDRFSSHAPFHFDLSILDIFVPIKHAAYVRLISETEAKQPASLAQLIEAECLTFWYSTPTILRAMMEHTDLASYDHSSLRTVCFAGEVFPTKHFKKLAEFWPDPKYYNLFGPTETNVCTFQKFENPQTMRDENPVPIGTAASQDELRIVLSDGQTANTSEEGELLVSGGSVMRGYWNAPEKNAEVFAKNDGKTWYRTGDIVVEGDDGALLYRGRRDRMVKRRGYRVELGEIEAALLRHADISECAAVAVKDGSGSVQIVAFYTWSGDNPPSLITLKKYSSQALPTYMIPDRFSVLEEMPNTSTNKLDFQSLKEIACGLFADR